MSPKEKAAILKKFAFVTPVEGGAKCRVAGSGRRGGQLGVQIAIIGLKHAHSHEVVLRFPDGKIDSFTPHNLFAE